MPRGNRRLWINAAALALALIAVVAVMRPRAVVVPDEGLYLAQADALTDSSWSVEREAPEVDADGEFSRLLPEVIAGDREIPYARHAGYPLVITPGYWLGGYLGAIALSVLGLWGAAVSGAFIARRIDKRLGVPTLWLIGLGSPLLFYGFVTMGHALAAATAGAAFLGLSKWLDDRSWPGLAFGLPALLLTVGLRSEGTIYALAVVAAIGLMSLPARRTRRLDLRAFLTAGALGAAVLATYFLDTRVALAISGRDGYGVNPGRIATRASADPVSGSWASLLRPFANSWSTAALWVTLAAVLVIGASVVLRVAPKRSRISLVLMVAAVGAAVAMLVDPPWLVTGMIAAFPLLAAGLIWLRRSDLVPTSTDQPPERATSSDLATPAADQESTTGASPVGSPTLVLRIILVSVIATTGLIATLYANGGAAEWGGRFFQILLPILVPVVVLGLYRAASEFPIPQRRIAIACGVLVTAALSISALRAQADIRADATDTVDGTLAYVAREFPGETTLVVVANKNAGGNSRQFWAADSSADVLTAMNLDRLDLALEAAAGAGRNRAVVVTDADPDEFDDSITGDLDGIGWTVLDSSATPRGESNLYVVGEG